MKYAVLIALLFSTEAFAQTATEFMTAAEANRPKQGVVYTMTVANKDGSISYKASQKDAKWKMVSQNSSMPATVLFDGKQVTVSVLGMAVKDNSVQNYAALPIEDATFTLGEQTVKNGIACRMMTNDKGMTLCISEQFGLPVYTKTEEMQIDISDIRAAELKDSDFTLPKNTQTIDVSNMFFGQ